MCCQSTLPEYGDGRSPTTTASIQAVFLSEVLNWDEAIGTVLKVLLTNTFNSTVLSVGDLPEFGYCCYRS